MNVTAKVVVRLDGRHVHIRLAPAAGLGAPAEWMLSDDAANALRDELVRLLPRSDPEAHSCVRCRRSSDLNDLNVDGLCLACERTTLGVT